VQGSADDGEGDSKSFRQVQADPCAIGLSALLLFSIGESAKCSGTKCSFRQSVVPLGAIENDLCRMLRGNDFVDHLGDIHRTGDISAYA